MKESAMYIRMQLLMDMATRVIVYAIHDGPRAQLPEISEDLGYWFYAGNAPASFTPETVLDYLFTSDARIVRRRKPYAKEMPRLKLLAAQCLAIWDVLDSTTARRRIYTKNIPFQTEIYAMKEAQARKYIREHSRNKNARNKFPGLNGYSLLKSYAALYGMRPVDAAEAIIFVAEEARSALELTEHMRMHWTKKIMDAKSEREVVDIRKQMVEQHFRTW